MPDTTSRSFRSRVSELISDQVFARTDDSDTLVVDVVPADAAFRPFQGRIIRNIRVARVSVFEHYDETTEQSTVSALGRMGDALHIDTREPTIRKYFLMKAGERLDAEVLADTERLLRRTRFILDAKIEVLPVEQSSDSVDVLVVTRDNWSLGFDPRVKTARRFDFTIEERNLLGLGHQLRLDLDVDFDLNQQMGYTSRYTSDNLKGSFVLGEYRWRDADAERS
ncbi:MAG: hypothetical protein GWN29_05110, partial [Gammaproteobacteria bacterium]|nr:hypothetical protein [Gammaproteobacteria bacterium]